MTDRIAAIRRAAAGTPDISALPPAAISAVGKPSSDEKDSIMSETNSDQALADAKAAGAAEATKAANARFAAVLAHENYSGREALGQHMLATTDMSAEAIIGTMGKAAVAGGPPLSDDDLREAAEGAARKEMREQIASSGNSAIDADGGPSAAESGDAAMWGRSAARVNAMNGFAG